MAGNPNATSANPNAMRTNPNATTASGRPSFQRRADTRIRRFENRASGVVQEAKDMNEIVQLLKLTN
jgi:predicted type IV restriction endonuclease